MQPSTFFIPLFFILLPAILIATNTDAKAEAICNSTAFKDFPTEELGPCIEFGKEIHNKYNVICFAIIATAIPITILMELKGRWNEQDEQKIRKDALGGVVNE